MNPGLTVAVIDDDEAVLDSLRMMLGRYDFKVHSFTSAEDYLANRDRESACCVVCDVRLPDMSGLELQAELQKRKSAVPVVLITGHGDINMAVSAVKAGAHDFLEKPFSPDRLIETIKAAVDKAHNRLAEDRELQRLASRVNELSDRQKQVMDLAVKGLSNKEIAQNLQISPRTVETYRAWVMEKTGARNIAELVRLAMRLQDAEHRLSPPS
jgi:two-component system, LuxR family, response regulator FixJ